MAMPEVPVPQSAAQPRFHCSFCHQEVTDLSAHKRQIHASGFPSKCEIVQCQKWRRENPAQVTDSLNPQTQSVEEST